MVVALCHVRGMTRYTAVHNRYAAPWRKDSLQDQEQEPLLEGSGPGRNCRDSAPDGSSDMDRRGGNRIQCGGNGQHLLAPCGGAKRRFKKEATFLACGIGQTTNWHLLDVQESGRSGSGLGVAATGR